MQRSETIGAIAKALCKFQGEVKQPKKDANNPYFSSKYVPLEGVVSVITEPLANNGLAYFQSVSTNEEQVTVTTLVMHESGEFIESDPLRLPAYQVRKDGSKDYNSQGIGAAITYGRRYSLAASLGIASEDDDDGNTNAGAPDVTPKTQQRQTQSNTPAPPSQPSNVILASPNQAKMLYAKSKAGEVSMQRISDFLGYEVKECAQVHSKDVNKLIKMLDEAKRLLDEAAGINGTDEYPF